MNIPPRARVGALVVIAFAALALAPTSVKGAMDVVVTASPAQATAGQPVEILIRTFVPVIGSDLGLDVAAARTPFPAPSGYWNVLYAFADDYPFKVEARGPGGESLSVVVARDPSDASLYRGVATLQAAGRWRIQVLNYSGDTPGTWAEVAVRSAPIVPASDTQRGQRPAQEALATSVLAGVAGLAFGFLAGRTRRAVRIDRS